MLGVDQRRDLPKELLWSKKKTLASRLTTGAVFGTLEDQ